MEGLLGLLAPMLAQLAVTDNGNRRAPRAMVEIACVSLAVLGAVAAAGCLVVALWLFASPRIGPVAAPAACAITLIVVCAVLMLIGTEFMRRRKPAPTPMLVELLQNGGGERFIRDHKTDLLVAALVIGLVAGGSAPKPPPG